MVSLSAPSHPRARALGAAAAAVVLFGTVVSAPLAQPAQGAVREAVQQSDQGAETAAAADVVVRTDVEIEADGESSSSSSKQSKRYGIAEYTLEQFMFTGAVNWNGYKFTYYSQQVLPGTGLEIPGRYVNSDGYVSDEDGFIVLAGSAPKGTVYETPFGYRGKIYDRGTVGNHLDVYIR